jgi:hypothetical protein
MSIRKAPDSAIATLFDSLLTILIRLATPELAQQYTTALAPEKLAEYFAMANQK